MKLFQSYRIAPWEPEIIGVGTIEEASQLINAQNCLDDDDEDLLEITAEAIDIGVTELEHSDIDIEDSDSILITTSALKAVHMYVYQSNIGQFRGVPMIIDNHVTPNPNLLSVLLAELEDNTRIITVRDLEDWYWDFVTLNPFTIGTNIIGGIVLSAVSCFLQGNYLVEVTEGVHYD